MPVACMQDDDACLFPWFPPSVTFPLSISLQHFPFSEFQGMIANQESEIEIEVGYER